MDFGRNCDRFITASCLAAGASRHSAGRRLLRPHSICVRPLILNCMTSPGEQRSKRTGQIHLQLLLLNLLPSENIRPPGSSRPSGEEKIYRNRFRSGVRACSETVRRPFMHLAQHLTFLSCRIRMEKIDAEKTIRKAFSCFLYPERSESVRERYLLMQAPDNGEQALRSEGDRAKGLTWRRYTREHENLR